MAGTLLPIITIKPRENHLFLRFFFKTAIDQTNIKFGVVISWVNSIVQKILLP